MVHRRIRPRLCHIERVSAPEDGPGVVGMREVFAGVLKVEENVLGEETTGLDREEAGFRIMVVVLDGVAVKPEDVLEVEGLG